MAFAPRALHRLGIVFQTLALMLSLSGLTLPLSAAMASPVSVAPDGSSTAEPESMATASPTSLTASAALGEASPVSAASDGSRTAEPDATAPASPASAVPDAPNTAAPTTPRSAAPAALGTAAPTTSTSAAPTSVAPATPSTDAAHYDELLVSVSLNGVSVTENTRVLKDAGGVYYAGADDATAWNLTLKDRRSVEYSGQRYFVLDDFKASFDANRGILALTAPPSVFGLNIVNFQDAVQQPSVQPTFERGGFLNYDIAHHFGTQGEGFSGSFVGAYTVLDGIATTSVAQPGNGSGFVRLDTAFERDDLPAHTVLRFGDTVEAGGVLPLQRQFGGVQWRTDFALAPSFTTTAMPMFSGAFSTNGTLDILVNGHQVSQQQIPAGPFVLQNVPVPQGSGNVTLVLRNASGQVQTIASPFYETPVLLRQGVSQFELDAGSEREGYGIVSDSYDGMFLAAQGRRGVSNQVTLGGAIDVSAHAQTGSLAADYLVLPIGQVAATITGRTGLDPGLQQTYTYSYPGQHFTLGGQLMKSSPFYRDDACQLPCGATDYQLMENVSVPTGKSSSLSLSYAHRITTDGTPSRTAQLTYGPLSLSYETSIANDGAPLRTTGLTYGRSLGPGDLTFDILHSGRSPVTTTATALYRVRLGARGQATVSAVTGNGQSGQTVSYSQSLPNRPTGFGYQVEAETSPVAGAIYTANATEQLQNATVSQQFIHGPYSTLVSTDIAGSIDFVDHGVSMARTIEQGFGVVELPGYPGVPVFANGQEVGRTDARGRFILTQLEPYQPNEITLGGQGLPIGSDLVASALRIAPSGLSPAIARFALKSTGGITLTLVDSQGAVLPAGTKVVTADGTLHWIVAFDGQAFLQGAAEGKQGFTATTSTGTCSFELSVPKDTRQLPDLGVIVCR